MVEHRDGRNEVGAVSLLFRQLADTCVAGCTEVHMVKDHFSSGGVRPRTRKRSSVTAFVNFRWNCVGHRKL